MMMLEPSDPRLETQLNGVQVSGEEKEKVRGRDGLVLGKLAWSVPIDE